MDVKRIPHYFFSSCRRSVDKTQMSQNKNVVDINPFEYTGRIGQQQNRVQMTVLINRNHSWKQFMRHT